MRRDVLFCHEGGSHVSQRMWIVDVSTVRGRQAKPLYPQRRNEFCVHEYFTRQGDVGFQYELDRDGHVEYYNCFIRPDGTWIRQYLLAYSANSSVLNISHAVIAPRLIARCDDYAALRQSRQKAQNGIGKNIVSVTGDHMPGLFDIHIFSMGQDF